MNASHILRGSVVVMYGDPSRHQQTSLPIRGIEPSLVPNEPRTVSDRPTVNALTARQLDVFHLIVQGRSNKEIASALNLAEGTVKIHVAALFGKLGVHRRAGVAIAGARFISPRVSKSSPSPRDEIQL
jgi:DNA-binding NarL/FixJ family response regulator